MNDYEKQAQDFLEQTGATITARHKEIGPHFHDDDKRVRRDIWEVVISRGSRTYTILFGSSLADFEAWNNEIKTNLRNFWTESPETQRHYFERARSKEKDFLPAGAGHRPTAYNVLASLQSYEPEADLDDFAREYGLDKPSKAIRTFELIHKEWENVKMLFSDAEITRLQEIV